ncbi:MAG: phosphatase PAP2 family protein [Butyrivibrio sp.]|nr:phosphatase PAP2 family protein [Butyrivibrio sp.]
MNTKENRYTRAFFLLVVTAAFSLLAVMVDRATIGPNGTSVGFSALNGAFANAFGYNEVFDTVSDVMMGISFLVVISFAVMGVKELIRKKSIAKVNRAILGLGIIYIAVAIIYVVFGKIPVNYRPIIPPGETELETSYPSTHTLIIVTVMGSAMVAWDRVLSNEKLVRILKIAAVFVMAVGVLSRLFAGVHWFTDIIAGILFSLTLITFYSAWSLN